MTRFGKVPAFVLEAVGRGAFTYRQIVTYLACVKLANYTEPRRVRADVGTIAEAAGLTRSHASEALRALARPTDCRPAVIDYQPAKNQHALTVVVLLGALPNSGTVCPLAIPETGTAPGTAPGTARTALTAKTGPLEPESQRKSSSEPEHVREAARLLTLPGGRPVLPGKVAAAIAKVAPDAYPSEVLRAAEGVAGREGVKVPLSVFALALADERGRRESF